MFAVSLLLLLLIIITNSRFLSLLIELNVCWDVCAKTLLLFCHTRHNRPDVYRLCSSACKWFTGTAQNQQVTQCCCVDLWSLIGCQSVYWAAGLCTPRPADWATWHQGRMWIASKTIWIFIHAKQHCVTEEPVYIFAAGWCTFAGYVNEFAAWCIW